MTNEAELAAISHRLTVLRNARSHLQAALMQTVPTDDQIMMDHVRTANDELLPLIHALEKEMALALLKAAKTENSPYPVAT